MSHPFVVILGFCLFMSVAYFMVTDEPREIPQTISAGDCGLPKTTGQRLVSETWMRAQGLYMRECRTYVGVSK